MTLKEYLAALTDNPYFGAGFGLAGVGYATFVLRRGLNLGSIWFRRKCMMSLEVNNTDKSYLWLLEWINSNAATATQHLSVVTTLDQSDSGKITSKFTFIPGLGDHYLYHSGRFLKIDRNRDTKNVFHGSPYESVTLTTFGRDRKYFQNILHEAKELALQRMQVGVQIYNSFGHEWRPFAHPKIKRSLHSVVLDQGILEKIVADVKEFIARSQWYHRKSVPYRRGYLLHGPHGCGKSSFVHALASELEYSICVLSLSEQTLTEDRFNHLLNNAPLKSIILLEDVDAAAVTTELRPELKAAYAGITRITFSGLLNAIDGVTSSEGRILFMTTNHVDRLDPAVIRPGRVDVRQLVTFCSDYQLKELFKRFYDDVESVAEKSEQFCKAVRELNFTELSPAKVQEHFLIFKDDYKLALENVGRLKAENFAQENR